MRLLFIGFRDLLHPLYDDFTEAIQGRHPVELYDTQCPFAEQLDGVRIVVDQGGWGTHAMADAAAAAGIELWQVIGTGLDHIDVNYFLDRGIPVSYSPGFLSGIALAEHALMFMLSLAKKWNEAQQNLHSGVFYHPVIEELHGKTLGLLGFGGSARELAKRAWALGMRILAMDIVNVDMAILNECHVDYFSATDALPKLLRESDFLSIHVPITPQTKYMIDASAFARMKSTAFLINVARGDIVDQSALLNALRTGQIQGAGLDSFAQEPMDLEDPLLQMPNVLATPHIAGGTRGTSRRRCHAAAENVFRIAAGLPPLHLIQRR